MSDRDGCSAFQGTDPALSSGNVDDTRQACGTRFRCKSKRIAIGRVCREGLKESKARSLYAEKGVNASVFGSTNAVGQKAKPYRKIKVSRGTFFVENKTEKF